ncbi:MAG: YqgE/AlgH family protein [Pirellulales bacterium]|nr:YqgE/AlgH family protein [Pirellulales bacterium]
MSSPGKKSLSGHFLVAAPELADPNFRQAVVLLVEHSAQGALGLVLNRCTNVPVKQGWAQVSDKPCSTEEHLYVGGPCEGMLMCVHCNAECSEVEVVPDVHFSAQPEHIEHLVDQTSGPMRFFVGYSGWGAGQLEAELAQDSWLVLPASAEIVFAVERDLWARLRGQATANDLLRAMKVAVRPEDPSLN